MRKIFYVIIWCIIAFFLLQIDCYAVGLSDLKIELDKSLIHPNENVDIAIDFGQPLSEFEIEIAYDSNLFEYVSTSNDVNIYDNGNIITITYPTLSNNTSVNTLEVKFKAKSDIISTNPTNFKVTLQNLKDGTNLEVIDNPENPFDLALVLEPVYTNYIIDLSYDGTLISKKENDLKLTIKSEMGQNYVNTKLYAIVNSPENSEVEIFANDSNGINYNLVEEGWGGENGEPIGGKNVVKQLNLRGIFKKEGEYNVTFELVDINNSDYIIASNTFDIEVKNEDELKLETSNTITNLNTTVGSIQNTSNNENEVSIKTLPKAGSTIYFIIIPTVIIIILACWLIKKKDNEI